MTRVLKAGYLMLGALPNTFKVLVNGYKHEIVYIYLNRTTFLLYRDQGYSFNGILICIFYSREIEFV